MNASGLPLISVVWRAESGWCLQYGRGVCVHHREDVDEPTARKAIADAGFELVEAYRGRNGPGLRVYGPADEELPPTMELFEEEA